MQSSATLEPGTVLAGRYRIESVLGQGGMGAVYLARVEALQKHVALKEMTVASGDPARQARAVEQFQREAQFLANLEHPHLVPVTDFFIEGDRHYLVMAYVPGQSLGQWLKTRGRPEVDQVLTWGLQLAEVLDYLHTRNPPILFRDLKPSNIMLDETGRIRLIDFGIARQYEPGQATATFLQGIGSAGYAPLEQYHGAGGTDPRSDIYSLGATLYHLLTGQIPPSPVELVSDESELLAPRLLNPKITPELERVVLKMMGLRKENRYPSMQAARQALQGVAEPGQVAADEATENLMGEVPGAAAQPSAPLQPVRSKRATPAMAGVATALLLGGLLASRLPQGSEATPTPPVRTSASPPASPNAFPQIVTQPAQPTWSIRETLTEAQLAQAYGRLWQELLNHALPRKVMGPSYARYHEYSPARIDLEIGMILPEKLPGSGRIQASQLPAGRAARLDHRGGYEQIPQRFVELHQWVAEQKLQPGPGPYAVYRVSAPQETDPRKWLTELYDPLR